MSQTLNNILSAALATALLLAAANEVRLWRLTPQPETDPAPVNEISPGSPAPQEPPPREEHCPVTGVTLQEQLFPEPAIKREAFLIVADFPCAPCGRWVRRSHELPFRPLQILVQKTSPIGSFPVLWYPDADTQSGWAYYQGSVDDFIARYNVEAGRLEPKQPHSQSRQ